MDYQTARQKLQRGIKEVNASNFTDVAMDLFRFQATFNPVFGRWLQLLDVDIKALTSPQEVPFLPIRFFKSHLLQTGHWLPEKVFTSSGTTGNTTSRHAVRHTSWYVENCRRGFTAQYGPPEDYVWLALLPSYLERANSSLIAMADHFIRHSRHPESGFFLYEHEELLDVLRRCSAQDLPVVLLGVSFALLDLAENHPQPLASSVTIMETGGMKGRRRELTRSELHQVLKRAFDQPAIHSEYGMTELFSQAYSRGEGIFAPSPTMRVLVREVTDPFHRPPAGRSGALDIIDLANIDTLAFLATDDLGRVYEDGTFEVLGRLDASDIRGCNLLVA